MVNEIPDKEALAAILKSPDSPPRLLIDLTNSDGDATGVIYVALDDNGNVVEVAA